MIMTKNQRCSYPSYKFNSTTSIKEMSVHSLVNYRIRSKVPDFPKYQYSNIGVRAM